MIGSLFKAFNFFPRTKSNKYATGYLKDLCCHLQADVNTRDVFLLGVAKFILPIALYHLLDLDHFAQCQYVNCQLALLTPV